MALISGSSLNKRLSKVSSSTSPFRPSLEPLTNGSGYLSGSGEDGVTKVEGVPSSALVRVLDRDSGRVFTSFESDSDGTWRLERLPIGRQFDLVFREEGYQDGMVSAVTPAEPPSLTITGSFTLSTDKTALLGSLTVAGGVGPYFVETVQGAGRKVPPGIGFALSGTTLTALGSCKEAGDYSWTLRVTDSITGRFQERSLTFSGMKYPKGEFALAMTSAPLYLWWRLDQGPGAGIYDHSVNARVGAFIAGVLNTDYTVLQPGLVNDDTQAIKLLTDTASVRLTTALSIPTQNTTYVCAFKSEVSAPGGVITHLSINIAASNGSGARDRGFVLGTDGKLYFTFWDGSASRRVVSLAAVNDGQPYIAHVVVGTTTTKLFVNGVLQQTISYVPGLVYLAYLFLGALNIADQPSPITLTTGFRGVIDEVAIYTTALSDAAVLVQAQAARLAP